MTKINARRPDGSMRLCPSTAERYQIAVNNHIIPGKLGNIWVEHLVKRDVERWRDDLAEHYKSATINGWHRVLRDILKSETVNQSAALVPSLLEDDSRTTEDEPNLVTLDDLGPLLKAFAEDFPQHYPLAFLLVTTTMRISTARALLWSDIDTKRGVIHCRKRVSKKQIIPGVKRGRKSKDTPPLLPALLDVLMAHRETFNERQTRSGLVFPNEKGGLISRSVLDKPMKTCLAKAGIPTRLTPSTGFRRTGVVLYRGAADSAVAQDIAGHLTLAMHRHYGPSQDAEKSKAAETAFGAILRKP
jgi:integrase